MISCNKEIIFNIKNKLVILLSSIVIISFIIMIILAHLLKVEKYYQNKGIVVLDNDNYYLKLYVDFENIETIINNSSILINEDNYQYNIITLLKIFL